jgi:predicted transcriptional regulator
MAQVLDKELHKYWDLLDTPQKKSILSLIKSFMHHPETESSITLEQYNLEIDAAMDRMDKGEFISNDEVEKEMDKW